MAASPGPDVLRRSSNVANVSSTEIGSFAAFMKARWRADPR